MIEHLGSTILRNQRTDSTTKTKSEEVYMGQESGMVRITHDAISLWIFHHVPYSQKDKISQSRFRATVHFTPPIPAGILWTWAPKSLREIIFLQVAHVLSIKKISRCPRGKWHEWVMKIYLMVSFHERKKTPSKTIRKDIMFICHMKGNYLPFINYHIRKLILMKPHQIMFMIWWLCLLMQTITKIHIWFARGIRAHLPVSVWNRKTPHVLSVVCSGLWIKLFIW